MIVVAIIGILASIAIPSYQNYKLRAKMSELAQQFGQMKNILTIHAQETGGYPDGTHVIPPSGVTMPDYWSKTTILGGNFNWEGPDQYAYAGIAILGATASDNDMTSLIESLMMAICRPANSDSRVTGDMFLF